MQHCPVTKHNKMIACRRTSTFAVRACLKRCQGDTFVAGGRRSTNKPGVDISTVRCFASLPDHSVVGMPGNHKASICLTCLLRIAVVCAAVRRFGCFEPLERVGRGTSFSVALNASKALQSRPFVLAVSQSSALDQQTSSA